MIDFYSKVAEYKNLGKDLVVVTVTEKSGMGPADVGKKMAVLEDGSAFGTVGGGAIEFYARNKCKEVIERRESFTEKYCLYDREVHVDDGEVKLNMACGGHVTLFYEFVGPKNYVYIFGAGHCGAALARILRPLNFFVTIIDERDYVIDALDDSANIKVNKGFVQYIEENGIPDNRYIVVCTPSHQNDYNVLDKILELKMKPRYFGMLCSKKKVTDYFTRAVEKYGEDIDFSNFYSPIGLQTGGDSPEEVAISIASEILSVFYKKEDLSSHMRDTVKESQKYFKKR